MVLVVNLNGRTVAAHSEMQPDRFDMGLARSGIVAVHFDIVAGRFDTERGIADLLGLGVVEIAEGVRKLDCWGIAAAYPVAQRVKAAEQIEVDLVGVGKAGVADHTVVNRNSGSLEEVRIASGLDHKQASQLLVAERRVSASEDGSGSCDLQRLPDSVLFPGFELQDQHPWGLCLRC